MKAVLHKSSNFVFGKVGHNVLAKNVFDQFSTNTCQGDRPVVRSSMPISLFEHRGYISLDPFIG